MSLRDAISLTAILLFVAGCGDKAAPKAPPKADAHDHEHGPNGGEILELGAEEGHLELIHDHLGGNVTVFAFGKDLKSPVAIPAPTITIQTKDGLKEFTLTAASEVKDGKALSWKGSHAGLVSDPWNGRIRVNLGGKDFQSPLEGAHSH